MKEQVQVIINDLTNLMNKRQQEEDYETCAALKDVLASLSRYMKDEVDYDEIELEILDLCFLRYELMKLVIVNKDRYALFSVLGEWFLFHIDTVKENSDMWKDLVNLQKEQEKKILEFIREVAQG